MGRIRPFGWLIGCIIFYHNVGWLFQNSFKSGFAKLDNSLYRLVFHSEMQANYCSTLNHDAKNMPPTFFTFRSVLIVAFFAIFLLQEHLNNAIETQRVIITFKNPQKQLAVKYEPLSLTATHSEFIGEMYIKSFLIVLGERLRSYGHVKNSNLQ